jgi:nicotinate-nucleotide pyrophosphorylase (carboxylating)
MIKDDIAQQVALALNEDVGSGDVTAALLSPTQIMKAVILSREPMLVCGQPWVEEVFHQIDASIAVHWLIEEGTWLDKPTTLCSIQGVARNILTAERTALNFLQTLSGTATQTHYYLQRIKGYQTQLLDTRKTLPGLRLAQKYAVSTAGGMNHRLGLYDAYLIKENHIKACGSIRKAIDLARLAKPNVLVEVEVETLDELREALDAKPDRILLDNFTIDMLCDAVAMSQQQCKLEASGGVDLSTIESIAQTGVDFISVGSITKSVQAIDLSLLIQDHV